MNLQDRGNGRANALRFAAAWTALTLADVWYRWHRRRARYDAASEALARDCMARNEIIIRVCFNSVTACGVQVNLFYPRDVEHGNARSLAPGIKGRR